MRVCVCVFVCVCARARACVWAFIHKNNFGKPKKIKIKNMEKETGPVNATNTPCTGRFPAKKKRKKTKKNDTHLVRCGPNRKRNKWKKMKRPDQTPYDPIAKPSKTQYRPVRMRFHLGGSRKPGKNKENPVTLRPNSVNASSVFKPGNISIKPLWRNGAINKKNSVKSSSLIVETRLCKIIYRQFREKLIRLRKTR